MWLTQSDAAFLIREQHIHSSKHTAMLKKIAEWKSLWQKKIWGSKFLEKFVGFGK
jgi:hypothetical protein